MHDNDNDNDTAGTVPAVAAPAAETISLPAGGFGELSFSLPDKPTTATETNKGCLGPARLAAHVTIPIIGTPIAIRRGVWLEQQVDAEAGTVRTVASFSLSGRKSDISYDRKDPDAVDYVSALADRVYAAFGPWYAVAKTAQPIATAAKMSNAPRLVLDGRALTAAELASLRQSKR